MRHAVSAPPSRDRPRLNKGLGQHLLVSAGVLDDIVTAAEIGPNDLVVEVGPGTGILTARLLAVAESVIAVEIDPEMAAYIEANLEDQANLSLIVADIRAQDPARLTASRPYIVVANLPYYAASPTIRMFLESAHAPRRMVVTVQREVATEMTAVPGRASLLTLATQVYADARVVRRIKPGSFVPAPAVESSVVRLDVLSNPRVDREFAAVVLQSGARWIQRSSQAAAQRPRQRTKRRFRRCSEYAQTGGYRRTTAGGDAHY